jgi:DNA mismatch repair protein MutS2
MNEKALRTLEYEKIIQKLVGYAVSPMAKERAADLRPSSAISDIAIWQQETTEATTMQFTLRGQFTSATVAV